jgi:hypothetical protein
MDISKEQLEAMLAQAREAHKHAVRAYLEAMLVKDHAEIAKDKACQLMETLTELIKKA